MAPVPLKCQVAGDVVMTLGCDVERLQCCCLIYLKYENIAEERERVRDRETENERTGMISLFEDNKHSNL